MSLPSSSGSLHGLNAELALPSSSTVSQTVIAALNHQSAVDGQTVDQI
jgi:hypothetical protein